MQCAARCINMNRNWLAFDFAYMVCGVHPMVQCGCQMTCYKIAFSLNARKISMFKTKRVEIAQAKKEIVIKLNYYIFYILHTFLYAHVVISTCKLIPLHLFVVVVVAVFFMAKHREEYKDMAEQQNNIHMRAMI